MKQKLRDQARRLKPDVLRRHSNQCYVCGFSLRPILVMHHITPISMNGNNDPQNVVSLCPNCHAIVHKVMDYAQYLYSKDVDKESMPTELAEVFDWFLGISDEAFDKIYELAKLELLAEEDYAWAF